MKVIEISSDSYQSHTIILENRTITLEVRFLPTVSMWSMKVLLDDVITLWGQALSCGTVIMEQNNKPFGFYVTDNSTLGIDPFRVEDFADGRCTLYLLEREDMIGVRKYDVE